MAMTETEKEIIQKAISKIRPDGMETSVEVREALERASIYLESWVLPALEILVEEPHEHEKRRRAFRKHRLGLALDLVSL